MGLGLFRHWNEDDWSDPLPRNDDPPNPDPTNFKIRKIEKIGDYLWVLVNYPNCNTYGGNKILIFKGITIRRLKMYGILDPHFSESGLTPIARFRPDPEGVRLSFKFCESC